MTFVTKYEGKHTQICSYKDMLYIKFEQNVTLLKFMWFTYIHQLSKQVCH